MSTHKLSLRIDDSGVPFEVEGLDLGRFGRIVASGYGASIEIPDGAAYSPIVAGIRLTGGECRYDRPFTVRFNEKRAGHQIQLSIEDRPYLERLHERLGAIQEEIFEERERRSELEYQARYEEFAKTLEPGMAIVLEHYNHDTGSYYYTIYGDSDDEFDHTEITPQKIGAFWVTTSGAIQAARAARAAKGLEESELLARRRAEVVDKRKKAKAQAIASGRAVEYVRKLEPCDGSVEECTWDTISFRIGPDGSESVVRIHCH